MEAGSDLSRIGQSIINTLPPAFLMLILINIVFLWLVLGFIERQADQRLVLVNRIVDACIARDMVPLQRRSAE